MLSAMLVLGIIVFGMAIDGVAQLILGRSGWKVNWVWPSASASSDPSSAAS
jgi:hypothetical protein